MELLDILEIFGIPSMIIGLVIYVIKAIVAMKKGLQALLRSNLIDSYNHYTMKGYAPIYARENFENVYTQYHNLGANGVMGGIREKFFQLPTDDNTEENNE